MNAQKLPAYLAGMEEEVLKFQTQQYKGKT